MLTHIGNFLRSYCLQARTLWIACSGGMDSMVLLDLCAQLDLPISLKPVYIHHGVHPQADVWLQHCERVAKNYELTLTHVRLQITFKPGDSQEAVLRAARYAALADLMQPGDLLCTAHHADDQVETVLLQLLRGSGVAGLAAMPTAATFAQGLLLRPLLSYSKETLTTYANAHQLAWVEDSSNQDLKFDRNFLRHTIVPQLKQRWPSMVQTFSRSSQHCGEAQALLAEYAYHDLAWVQAGLSKHQLCVNRLQTLSDLRQRHMLRCWFKVCNVQIPSTKKLQHVITDVIQAKIDAMPYVSWGDVAVRRYQDKLFLTSRQIKVGNETVLSWDLTTPLVLPNNLGVLQFVAGHRPQSVTVRFRPSVSMSLKKIWQQVDVPPWLRDGVPLVYCGDELIAVGDYWQATNVAQIQWIQEPHANNCA